MEKHRLFKLSGSSGVTAGILFLFVGASFILTFFIGEKALVASGFLLVLGTLFELFAILGFFGCQVEVLPRSALTGFILMIAGLMIDLFPPAGRVLFTIGLLLFALANQRTHTLSPGGFWIWLIGSAVVLTSSFIGGHLLLGLGAIINAGALIWLGTALRKQMKQAKNLTA